MRAGWSGSGWAVVALGVSLVAGSDIAMAGPDQGRPILLANPCAERPQPPANPCSTPRRQAPAVVPPSTIRDRVDQILRDQQQREPVEVQPQQQEPQQPAPTPRPADRGDDAIRRLGEQLRRPDSSAPTVVAGAPGDPG